MNNNQEKIIDFTSNRINQRLNNIKTENICKSIGKIDKTGLVVDLTAGLGRDSLLLAKAGHKIHLNERNMHLYNQLNDELNKLLDYNPNLRSYMSLSHIDSTSNVTELISQIELSINKSLQSFSSITVYIDPMYPENTIGRKSLVKKETQLLHDIINNSNEDNTKQNDILLFYNACQLSTNKVIVKRPLKADPIVSYDIAKPNTIIKGSTQRFDVYLATTINKLSIIK